MSTDRVLLALALVALESDLSREKGGKKHIRDCRFSTWVDGYSVPDGAPCSPKCSRKRALAFALRLHLAGALGAAEMPRQLELVREAS